MKNKTFTSDEINRKKSNIIPLKPVLAIGKFKDIIPKKIDWLWKDRAAFGKITLFAGDPGVGKSQLLLYIASIISQGAKFHLQPYPVQKSKVLLISGEDSPEDTILPRLMSLGADMDYVDYVKGIKKSDEKGNVYYDLFSIIQHVFELESLIIQEQYKLIIIDPITLYMGSTDSNSQTEIRSVMAMLSSLAERLNIAIIINSHFSKPSGNFQRGAIYRIMGSLAFAAAARIVIAIAKDPNDPSRRLFVPIKNNLSQDTEGLVYKIKSIMINDQIETSCVDWLNEKIFESANDILNPGTKVESPRLDEVKQFLLDILKDGSVSLSEIRSQAVQLGFSINRLYKAKNELKIYENASFMNKRGKIWSLSPET